MYRILHTLTKISVNTVAGVLLSASAPTLGADWVNGDSERRWMQRNDSGGYIDARKLKRWLRSTQVSGTRVPAGTWVDADNQRTWISRNANARGYVDGDRLQAWLRRNEVSSSSDLTPGEVQPVGVSGSWRLVFREEFAGIRSDGTGLDTSSWNANWLNADVTITKPVNSAELCAYSKNNVSVRDGFLHLRAASGSVRDNSGRRYSCSSGLVESARRQDFTYGYFEAKLCMEMHSAQVAYNWPAWWTNGYHNDHPDRGENDIMENLSHGPAWHYHAPAGSYGRTIQGNWNDCHVFGSHWQTGRIRFYYDGRLVGDISGGIVLDYPHYLILNLGVSREHGGPMRLPSVLKVDYVRVWRSL